MPSQLVLRAAVLGSPVAHSLSPVLHRAAYASLGLTGWQYDAIEVREHELGDRVAAFGDEWRGLSLTMPLKEAAFAVAETVTELATRAGAINTLVRRPDGGWDGHNTDVQGIVEALRPALAEAGQPAPRHGLVLGAGATARSALLALAELGVSELVVAARDIARAQASVGGLAEGLGLSTRYVPLGEWPDVVADVAISTLPPTGARAASEVLVARGTVGTSAVPVLLDVVYADWPTPLADAATASGTRVVGGLAMLVHQAVAQVALMTGHRPDPQVLLAAGQAALAARGTA
ncbi:shikimate dehydrogenase [Janibacter sp. G1551]|uniref:shikimate dehydrogenase n=1 Tax=Janibacter sp. G1551 TaxID=3420440 RepID=UPI003D064AA1